MPTLSNSEDPDEMPHHAAFHQGLHCLLAQNRYAEKDEAFHQGLNCLLALNPSAQKEI